PAGAGAGRACGRSGRAQSAPRTASNPQEPVIGQYRKHSRQPSALFGLLEVEPNRTAIPSFRATARDSRKTRRRTARTGLSARPKFNSRISLPAKITAGAQFSVGALKVSHWLCPTRVSEAEHEPLLRVQSEVRRPAPATKSPPPHRG